MTAVLRALTVIIISSRRWLHDAVWRWGLPLEELRVVVCECGVSVGCSEMSPSERKKKAGWNQNLFIFICLFIFNLFPPLSTGRRMFSCHVRPREGFSPAAAAMQDVNCGHVDVHLKAPKAIPCSRLQQLN
jgi:hypothetical protein